jgi:hypothetical protein
MKYIKKPIIVEAIRWTGKNWNELENFCPYGLTQLTRNGLISITVDTLEGKLHAKVGDWIIKGVEGEFYPCKPDIFKKTYEEVPHAQ